MGFNDDIMDFHNIFKLYFFLKCEYPGVNVYIDVENQCETRSEHDLQIVDSLHVIGVYEVCE